MKVEYCSWTQETAHSAQPRRLFRVFDHSLIQKNKIIPPFGTGTRLSLLYTIGAEHCIICEGSRGPGVFLFAVAELLNSQEA